MASCVFEANKTELDGLVMVTCAWGVRADEGWIGREGGGGCSVEFEAEITCGVAFPIPISC